MKNFSELLATNFAIDICLVVVPKSTSAVKVIINDQCIYDNIMKQATSFRYSVPLLEPIKVLVYRRDAYVESLTFDGWESRPEYGTEDLDAWSLETNVPFYQWKHWATGQGWLLTPH